MKDVHGGVTHVARVPLLEGRRGQNAEGVIEEFLAEEHRDARIHVFADFVVNAAARDREELVVAVVERARRLEVDRCAQRAFLDIRGRRLAYGELREDLGGKHVEVEGAAIVARAIDVAGTGLRGAFHAVDADLGETRAETANRDVAAFAAVAARERDTRHALHGFSKVAVRELADVFRRNDVDGSRLVALGRDRGVQRSAETGYHDLFDFLRSRLILGKYGRG